MLIRVIVLITLLVSCSFIAVSQVPSESEAKAELEKRGIDEAEFRAELLARGIDIDNINTSDPAELLRVQETIEEVMAQLEAKEAVIEGNEQVLISQADEIQEAVEDGATLEEAITEELQEEVAEELPQAQLYGHHLFRNKSIKFYRKSEDAKPPDSYIIGPGDKISVAIWGEAELNFSQEVTNDGFIKPAQIARIYVGGLTIEEARKSIRSKLSRNYRFDQNTFEINVVTARTINVNITGEVFNVGSYSISALNTAFNALVAAGGPSDIGSVRRIKVASSQGGTKTLDLYRFLSDPLIGEEFYLFENDYIVVPVAEKVVEIGGAVNRPFRYELLESEDLMEIIDYAGGLKANALKRSIKITRLEDDEEKIINVNLRDLQNSRNNFKLKNGDVIEVQTIPRNYENVVSVEGAVELPGEYAFQPNMKIGDLLEMAKVDEDAILETAYLMRLNDDRKTVRYQVISIADIKRNPRGEGNLLLRRGDKLTVRSKSAFADTKSIEVEGAVRLPGTYPYNGDALRTSDALFLSGGLTENATDFAFIFREKPGTGQVEYIPIDLVKIISGDSDADVNLRPGDKIVVYDRLKYSDQSFVSVSGSVRNPKDIAYDSTLTIKKALLLAGGLTFDASLQQIDIFRIDFSSTKKTRTLVANVKVDANYNVLDNGGSFRLEPFDQVVVRKAPEFELQRNVRIEGEVKYAGTYALVSENARLSEVIRQAGGVTDEAFLGGASLQRIQDDVGYVIIDLEKALNKSGKTFDVVLQDGDIIRIPKINELVTVSGAVLAKNTFSSEIAASGKYSFAYEPGKNAKYYIDKYAGGVSEDGKASRITVRYPNGELKKTRKFLFFNNYPEVVPGSYINVGYKDPEEPKGEGDDEGIDWGEVLSDSVAQATTILTLVILINNLD